MQDVDDDAIFQVLKEMIKADIEKYEGYTINGNDVICHVDRIQADFDAIYDKFKDCAEYIKAVKKFNAIYTDDFINYTMQSYLTDNLNFPFNVMLSFIDTYFIYQKLKDNDLILAEKKKIKLKCDKIKPKSIYTRNASYIELAMKRYKKLDDTTKKEVLSIVYYTVRDASIIDHQDTYNAMGIVNTAEMNDISLSDAELLINAHKKIADKDYKFN